VRAQIVGLLGFAGFKLDAELNATHGRAAHGRITRSTSPMAAVVPTNEQFMIARDTAEIIARDPEIAAHWNGASAAMRAVQ
jgi:acetate kinase